MLPRVQWSDYRQHQKTLNLLKLMKNLVAGARNRRFLQLDFADLSPA
jgi:hypothetical protein